MHPVAVFIFAAPVLIFAFLAFDELIILQRDRYPAQWNACGCPHTFYKDAQSFKKNFSTSFAMQKYCFVWLFKTPDWASADADARKMLLRLRILVGVWNLVLMPLFLSSMLKQI